MSGKRFGGLVATLLLIGCVGSTDPQPAVELAYRHVPKLDPLPERDQEGGIDPAVFRVGYGRIDEAYLTTVDFGELTVDGLAHLDTIDDGIRVRRSGGEIAVTRDAKAVVVLPAPAPSDALAWADVAAAALDAATAASPSVRDAGIEALYQAVYDGALADLDPYTRYTGRDRSRDERASREGYSGIGIVLGEDETGRPTVGEVFPGGPAARAGLVRGERILAVDGESTEGRTIGAIGDQMRGASDSRVALTLMGADERARTVTMKRERVIPNVVTTRIDNGYVIVRVMRFNAATSGAVAGAIEGALSGLGDNARGIILDLRGNPGGLLDQSVDVADLFIDRGDIISTRGRHPDSMQLYPSHPDDLASHLPMAVLQDGHSASGSEVAAAALQDSGRAVIVGSSSFGKGSVQTVTRLPNDGELYLTWSRIFAPSGYTLHRQGVTPTVCTSGEIEDAGAMVEAFRAGTLPHAVNLIADRLAAPDDAMALDRLRGACPWQEHRGDLDVEVAVRVLGDQTLYAQALAAAGTTPTLAYRDDATTGAVEGYAGLAPGQP